MDVILIEDAVSFEAVQEGVSSTFALQLEYREGLNRGGRYLRHENSEREIIISPYDTDDRAFGKYMVWIQPKPSSDMDAPACLARLKGLLDARYRTSLIEV